MNKALKKTLSIILTILMIALSIPVIFAAESPFDPNYRVTLKFKIYQRNIYNDIYTGPGFDTDGMGVTIYYLDDDGKEKYTVYDITSGFRGYEDGYYYADVSCSGIPTKFEYYSEGTAAGDHANEWALYSLSIGETVIWDGCIWAVAEGPQSYIATVSLVENGIIKINSEGVLGHWETTETKMCADSASYIAYTDLYCYDSDSMDWTIADTSYMHRMFIDFADQYGVVLSTNDLEDILYSEFVTIICHCSASSEGIELVLNNEKQPCVDYKVTENTISATMQWSYYNYLDFYIKINPEAVGEEWDEQSLSFSVKFYDRVIDCENEIYAEEKICLIDSDRIFTLDAAGGSFTDGEESESLKDITKKYYNKLGEIPVPERQGYKFNGFYLTPDDNSDDDIVPDSERLTEDTVLAENQTWYASWSRNAYGVTYSYLNESGKRVRAEYSYKYEEEYSAPEIPRVIIHNDTRFTFAGWSPEFVGTNIMTDANLYYEAQYATELLYADYSVIDAAVAQAEKVKSDEEYTLKYTEDSRAALDEALKLEGLQYGSRLSYQPTVDAYAKSITDAVQSLTKNKFKVVFVDESENVISSSDVDYGANADIPQPAAKYIDSEKHFKFVDWDKSTEDCKKVTCDMKFTARYTEEEHSFTNYVLDKNGEGSEKTLIAHCDGGCGATDKITIITSCAEHTDNDNDGICDNCNAEVVPDTPDKPTDDTCDHLCHKDGILGFLWKIISFFYRLFNIQQYCDCGELHYDAPVFG